MRTATVRTVTASTGRLVPMPPYRNATERFWEKIALWDSCWMWEAGKNKSGYGQLWQQGAMTYAHHFLSGPPPDGMEYDHLCRNRACVRPEHLELVTHKANTLRGEGVGAVAVTKTHCPTGHAYDEENTYRYRGRRYCRACKYIRNKIRREPS